MPSGSPSRILDSYRRQDRQFLEEQVQHRRVNWQHIASLLAEMGPSMHLGVGCII
jgi:hypothetical protein